MAVFRVEKTKDFTIMCNHHLRNTELSLKAKGMLSLMVSLPDNWDYTTKGLSFICKDGVDSISTALKELARHGYLTRQRLRYENGQLGDIEYTIHEQPVTTAPEPSPPSQAPSFPAFHQWTLRRIRRFSVLPLPCWRQTSSPGERRRCAHPHQRPAHCRKPVRYRSAGSPV